MTDETQRVPDSLFRWGLVAGVAILAVMSGPFLAGRFCTHDDLGGFHLPTRAFYAQQLGHGEPFDWVSSLYGGFYLTGEGQVGAYHPWHWALYRFLPLRAAMACELVGSYAFLFAGMYLFLRQALGRRDAAILGSLAFTFCGFNFLRFVHPNAVAVVAHVPWLLATIAVVLTDVPGRRRALAGAAVALLTGSQLLVGHPQYVWFSLLVETAYAVFLGVRSPGRWLHLAAAKAVGGMLGAVQILPTVESARLAARPLSDAAFADTFALHPGNVVQWVAPYLLVGRGIGGNTHESTFYLGAVPLMLIAWLLSRHRDWGPWRKWTWAAMGFAAVGFLLALGSAGGLYCLQRWLPLVSGFRCPNRYLLFCYLSAGVLAAIGFRLLVDQCGQKRSASWREFKMLWLVVAVSAAVALTAVVIRDRTLFSTRRDILCGPLLIAASAWLVMSAARGNRWALTGLVLLTAVDLGIYGLGYAVYRHTHRLDEYLAEMATPPDAQPPARTLGAENPVILLGWQRIDGCASLAPARRLDYRQLAALRVSGVRWVRRSKHTADIAGLIPRGRSWFEVPDPLPWLRLVTRSKASAQPAEDLGRIPIDSTALTESRIDLPEGTPGTVTLVSRQAGRLALTAECSTAQLLVIAESYHPGWEAHVDGEATPVLRVNGDYQGCQLGPGRHEIEFTFRPRSLRYGAWITGVGTIVLAAGLAWGLWRSGDDRSAS